MNCLKTETFIQRAGSLHNNFYDYSKSVYTRGKEKICIICPAHGEFYQISANHLMGQGCPTCGQDKKKVTKEEFITRSMSIHKNKYTYDNISYVNTETKVSITCLVHGNFYQKPEDHMSGYGCKLCGEVAIANSKKKSHDEYIRQCSKVHKNKYDYSKTVYKGVNSKICIICPIHGDFYQSAGTHILGMGCPTCGFISMTKKITLSQSEFIERSLIIHDNKYDYSKVQYVNNRTKVCIICPKHGEFHQIPGSHLNGIGCRYCSSSHGERSVSKWLKNNGVEFKSPYSFPDLMGRCKKLTFDFFIPSNGSLIEYDGEHHFMPIKFWGSASMEQAISDFETVKYYDSLKNQYCAEKGIPLLRISYKELKKVDQVLDEKFPIINQYYGTNKVLKGVTEMIKPPNLNLYPIS
jgi:hypothetical protein